MGGEGRCGVSRCCVDASTEARRESLAPLIGALQSFARKVEQRRAATPFEKQADAASLCGRPASFCGRRRFKRTGVSEAVVRQKKISEKTRVQEILKQLFHTRVHRLLNEGLTLFVGCGRGGTATPHVAAPLHGRGPRMEASMLGTILIVVLLLLLVGAFPAWPYSRSWGYAPTGTLGLIVVIVVVLVVLGQI
jgi:hypothetical protein